MSMFGVDGLMSFEGAELVFIGLTVVLYLVAAYVGRSFTKKI